MGIRKIPGEEMHRTLQNECAVATRAARLSLPPLFTRAWGKAAGLLASLKPPTAADTGSTVRSAPFRNRPSVLKSCRGKPDVVWVMFQALLLLLAAPTSAFAATESNHEIGVPQPMEARAKGCFGVVLSPDGDGFYSVRDGLLSHYRIAPFKKIGSIAIDEAQLKDIPEKDSCRVLITDDGSNLILVFRNWLVSLDRRTGKITRKVERQAVRSGHPYETVMLNENDLVILSEYRDPEWGVWFYLTVLDVSTFRLKRPVFNVGDKVEFSYGYGGVSGVAKIQDRLYLSSGKTLAVLNSKTYEPELTLTCPKLASGYDTRNFWTSPMISKDYRKLYAVNATVVNDYLAKAQKAFGEPQNIRDNFVLSFDQTTRQSSSEPTDRKIEGERRRRRDLYEPWLFWGTTTRNRDYVAASLSTTARIANRNANTDYWVYQYESGEAILQEIQFPESKRIYHLTPNARQYLMVKNREGKVVHINDVTFEKYRANGAH